MCTKTEENRSKLPHSKGLKFIARGIGESTDGCFMCKDSPPRRSALHREWLLRLPRSFTNSLMVDVEKKEIPAVFELFSGVGVGTEGFHDLCRIRVNACNFHLPSLLQLKALTRKKNTITPGIVASCRAAKPTEHYIIPTEHHPEVLRLVALVKSTSAGTDVWRKDRSIHAAMAYGAAVHGLWEFLSEVTDAQLSSPGELYDWELDIGHMVVLKGTK